MAKMFATQSAMEVCTDAIQLMGGKGYMKEDCVEKCFRDIKAYCIFEGTNQIQKMVISGAVLSGKGSLSRSPLIDCNLPLSFFSVPGQASCPGTGFF